MGGKSWWKFGLMFVLMVVTGYGNAVINDGGSWVGMLCGSVGGSALWHTISVGMNKYEAKHKGV